MIGLAAAALSMALSAHATTGLSSWATTVLIEASEKLGLRAFETGTGQCPESAKVCVGLHVHPVVVDDEPVQTPLWFAAQIAHANDLFATIGVGFRVVEVTAAPAEHADMQTRTQRDTLGRADHDLGVVHVYLVQRLADVDIEGEVIRGVHWRDRAGKGVRRWVILSSIASRLVLAHELGHFFGLPHSRYAISIMNKRPAPGRPSWPDRVFHPDEVKIMAGRRDAMLADKTLVRQRKPRRRRASKTADN